MNWVKAFGKITKLSGSGTRETATVKLQNGKTIKVMSKLDIIKESVEHLDEAEKKNGFRISKVKDGTSKIKTGFGASVEIPMGMKNIGITVNTEKDAIKWAMKRYNIPKNIIKVKKIYHTSYDKEIQSRQADYHDKHRRGVRESIELDEKVDWGKMYGYIATYKGKELRIKENDADGIYAAKRFARRHFKIRPAEYNKLTVEPAMKESVEHLDEAIKISWNDAQKGFRTELLRVIGADIKNAYVLWNKLDKDIQRKLRGLTSQNSNGDIYMDEGKLDVMFQKLLKKYKMDKPHRETKKKEKEKINRIRKTQKMVGISSEVEYDGESFALDIT